MNWVADNIPLILQLAGEHLRQSLVAIVVGAILSIPLGAVAWRFRLIRGPIVVVTGLLYTIPSLALLILLPTVLGISAFDEINLVATLAIYNVALLVRAVVDGLDAVDAEVRLAATAMGYGALRRFWTVELPLAGPVVLAGLRVATASTIALATVGILVGVSNLGYLFTNGLQRRIVPEVLAGIVAVVVIAVILDLLLVLVGRLLLPWTRRVRAVRRPALRAAAA